jgi:hypothetical protein
LRCAGYCADGDIVLAGKHKLAPATFVHEFGHTCQFVEQSPLWDTREDSYEEYLLPKYDLAYLVKDSISSFQSFLSSIILERDCEQRAIKFIKQFDLPIDIEDYTRKANLYLFFYQYIFLKKKWTTSTTIYKPRLLREMPDKIVPVSRLKTIDMDLMDLYDKALG